ncbi:phage Gp37/Gp68 family protein [Sediminicoccus sp. KRV36]|uniref:phage Gp37/Gp68 family protein n=1 Tax=Sediminicoccus sp. KRV36 TaxID=3133721 RepID=UPI00200DCB57|nr:phage Gp37/Gp68 family protein [Sediminicoccus rosea]UPY35527.1 phage Gp37/Gp68 family protein [Sediminicoccus rosea]
MGQNSAIEWTDHTFNPWTGCTRVSPGCDHCYAEALSRRSPQTFGSWQPGAPRRRTSEAYWRQPLAWNRKVAREGRRARVFCASMADVFDNQVPEEWRRHLWSLIWETRNLDWLLLTKRPQNIASMLPPAEWHAEWPMPHVWLGTTVENQAEADRRIPQLLAVPAAKRFLSCEPLLGPVDLSAWWKESPPGSTYWHPNGLHWIIAGGESGRGARPMHPHWARSLRDQCAAASVPFFFKQWGDFAWRATGEAAGAVNGGFAIPIAAVRVGKKAAGRLLDGREHNEVPA